MHNPIIYLNKYCEETIWFQKGFLNAYILLDNHHLITRYRDNSNGNGKAMHALFMK